MASHARRTKLLLATGATFAALLLAEVAARVRIHRLNEEALETAFRAPPPHLDPERVALIDIIRASKHRKIVYELKANLDRVLFKGAPVTTNSIGFRGEEIDEAAGPDTVTIVGVGDSIMFGWGVGDGMEYPACLQEMLRAKYPAKRWRVINTGVPGYNTVMEVETLRTRGLAFHPDLVILNLVPNDLLLPDYLRVVEDVSDPGRSFLFELVAERLRSLRSGHPPGPPLPPPLEWHAPTPGEDVAQEGYDDMVGFGPFRTALGELRDLSLAHGFTLLSVSTIEDPVTVSMIDAVTELGMPHLRLLPVIQEYMAEHDGAQFSYDEPHPYLNSALVVKGDGHPSALQHRMVAEKLLERLEQDGTLERLLGE